MNRREVEGWIQGLGHRQAEVQRSGRAGLGWGTVLETWSKGSKRERKEMVIELVRGVQMEDKWNTR